MVAMAISFPNSFLNSLVYIFYGNTGDKLVANFHDVQDLEQHVMNIRGYINFEKQQDDYDFTEDIYNAFLECTPISIQDAIRFFMLCPEVCKVLDFIESDNAVEILRGKYPQALCR